MKIYANVRNMPMSGPALLAANEAVSFRRHMLSVMLFRDPWKLYDPIVLDALKNPRTEVFGGVIMAGEHSDTPPTMN